MHDDRRLALIDADHRHLVRAAARLLGPAEAEDAVQDAYVRALEAGAPQLDAAQAWLLTVVRHLAIDRLRRRRWMAQWLAQADADALTLAVAPSAESDAATAEAARQALRLLADRLSPADGAAVLLHEVFEVDHAAIAAVGGQTAAASRQRLRRALWRLRQVGGASPRGAASDTGDAEALLRLYMQSLQRCDPQVLWALLTPPTIGAQAVSRAAGPAIASARPASTACSVAQVAGQLALVLTLDGARLCVVPLGVRHEPAPIAATV